MSKQHIPRTYLCPYGGKPATSNMHSSVLKIRQMILRMQASKRLDVCAHRESKCLETQHVEIPPRFAFPHTAPHYRSSSGPNRKILVTYIEMESNTLANHVAHHINFPLYRLGIIHPRRGRENIGSNLICWEPWHLRFLSK